jgi:hypothetical protein
VEAGGVPEAFRRALREDPEATSAWPPVR